MRIAVLGYAGSGKIYISDCISKRKAIPCLHLDFIKYEFMAYPYILAWMQK